MERPSAVARPGRLAIGRRLATRPTGIEYHATMLRRRRLALIALILLVALTVYGFFHEHLFAQQMWSDDGLASLPAAARLSSGLSLEAFVSRPAMAGRTLACGLRRDLHGMVERASRPTGRAVFLLGACFFTGRIFSRRADAATALLLGLAGWMFAVWIALHFLRQHTRGVRLGDGDSLHLGGS